jgi:hypothetical protein
MHDKIKTNWSAMVSTISEYIVSLRQESEVYKEKIDGPEKVLEELEKMLGNQTTRQDQSDE